MVVDCIRNGTHGATEEHVEQPALLAPLDAPDEASKDNISSIEEIDEVEDDGWVYFLFLQCGLCIFFVLLKNCVATYDSSKPFTEFLVCECKRTSIFDLLVLVDSSYV